MGTASTATMTRDAYGDAYQQGGYGLTVRFLLSRGVPGESAEEAAQAAWARGWEQRRTLRNPQMVVTWVNSIALNLFRNWIRKEKRMEELPELPKSPDAKPANIDVRKTLSRCRPDDQALLQQHYLEGYTSAELAKSRGCKPVAVRVRLLRIRRKLKKMLAEKERKSERRTDGQKKGF